MASLSRADYDERLRRVRLLVMDVDGVLTDGGIVYFEDNLEGKQFHVRDGSAMYIARLLGVRTAVITASSSPVVERRFTELPVDHVRQGARQKVAACLEIQAAEEIANEEVAYMGDDLIDLPMMDHVGLSIAVADASQQLCAHVDWVTEKGGGCGAVREVVDDLVSARDAWDEVIGDYRSRFGAGVAAVAEEKTG